MIVAMVVDIVVVLLVVLVGFDFILVAGILVGLEVLVDYGRYTKMVGMALDIIALF